MGKTSATAWMVGIGLSLGVAGCMPPPPPAPMPSLSPQAVMVKAAPQAVLCWTGTPTRLVVVAVHGLKGSAGVFDLPARRWRERGIVTYAATLDYPNVTAEGLDALIREIASRHAGLPLMVVGESLGASMLLITLSQPHAPTVDGVVLAAPAIWPDAVSAELALSWVQWVSRARTGAYWGKIITVMNSARRQAASMPARPILVLSGGRDEVVSPLGISALIARLGPGTEHRAFPDGGHTLFRNAGGDAVSDQVADWMLAQAAAKAVATAPSAPASSADQASAN